MILGFTSQRDHHSGTWFIQSLVETFMNHAHDRELIDLLRVRKNNFQKIKFKKNNNDNHNFLKIYKLFDYFFLNLQMTSDYLSKFTNVDGEKQTCNVEMRHLYKRIYFKPGLKGTVVIVIIKSVHSN